MKKHVMVVDDSRVMELQMENLLKESDYDVAAYCRNGQEAIARYGEVLPDVVTMDILMPGMDGLETAQVILEEHPDAKIIMLSSLAYDDTLSEAKAIGTKGFIYKPFDKETLMAALDTAVADSNNVSAPVENAAEPADTVSAPVENAVEPAKAG